MRLPAERMLKWESSPQWSSPCVVHCFCLVRSILLRTMLTFDWQERGRCIIRGLGRQDIANWMAVFHHLRAALPGWLGEKAY